MKVEDKDKEVEGTPNPADTTEKPATPAKPVVKKTPAPATVEEEEEDDPQAPEQMVKMSQARFDNIVKREKAKQARTLAAQYEADAAAKDALIESLTKERDGLLTASTGSLKSEVDALPEEVKEFMPGDLTTSAGLKKVQEWLPKAKALAAKIGGKAEDKPSDKAEDKKEEKKEDKKETPKGNAGDPPPSAKTVTEKLAEEAKDHPFWQGF